MNKNITMTALSFVILTYIAYSISAYLIGFVGYSENESFYVESGHQFVVEKSAEFDILIIGEDNYTAIVNDVVVEDNTTVKIDGAILYIDILDSDTAKITVIQITSKIDITDKVMTFFLGTSVAAIGILIIFVALQLHEL